MAVHKGEGVREETESFFEYSLLQLVRFLNTRV